MPRPATVTLLFTDVVDSTRLWAELGDDRANVISHEHLRMLGEVCEGRGGRVVKTLGDGVMAVFPSVTAAVAGAADMQWRNERANRGAEHAVGLRVGIHAGDALRDHDDYFGAAVVTAKRLCDSADAGQVLVSDAVRTLTRAADGFRFEDLGALALKGLSDPVAAWEFLWRAVDRSDPDAVEPPASPPTGPDALPGPLASLAGGRFVGRADALVRLGAEWKAARAGGRRMVALAGEPGIGKTRLAAEFAARTLNSGATILYGRCDEEPLTPYQPFVEALGDRFTSAVERGSDRLVLFESVGEILAGAARDQPLLFVLDDAQWADKPTLLLLRHLLRSPSPPGLMALATYRDSEVGARDPLFELIAELRRDRRFERLPLSGLSGAEVGELAAQWARQEPPPALVRDLCRETEGHPFFVEETLRHLLESGALFGRRGRFERAQAASRLPESIRDVIEARVARLEPEVARALTVASVVGREFRASLLERVGEMPQEQILPALESAVAARLLDPGAATPDSYVFTHALVRQTLYETIGANRRALLHGRLARVLEEVHERDGEAHLADLAHHYLKAVAGGEELDKAVAYSIRAAAQAMEQLAYEEATGHYERALEGAAMLSAGPERRLEILLGLGDSRWASGEPEAARDAYAAAAELAERSGRSSDLARAALGFGGRVGFRTGAVDEKLIDLLERALERLGEDDPGLRAMLLARLAEARVYCSPAEVRTQWCREAESLARARGDDRILAFVLQHSTWALWAPDNRAERLSTAAETLDLARRIGDPVAEVEARMTLLAAELEQGLGAPGVDAALEELQKLVKGTRQPHLRWLMLVLRAIRALYDRPIDEAEAAAREALDVGLATGNSSAVEIFGAQMAFIRYLQGRLPEMHATVSAYCDLSTATPSFRVVLAMIYTEMGREADARREFEALARDGFASVLRDLLWFTSINQLSLVCSALGDARSAERLYEMLAPHEDAYCSLGTCGVPSCSFARHLGVLAATSGRFDDAERHFEAALERNERTESRLSVALTKLQYGQMLVTRDGPGDRERASVILADACRIADRLGLTRIARKARSAQETGVGWRLNGATGPVALRDRVRRLGGDAKATVSTRGRGIAGRLLRNASPDDLERRFGSLIAQRALLTGMATSFQPRMAYGFEGELELQLSHVGEERPVRAPDWWTITIRDGRAVARHRPAKQPAMSLRAELPVFLLLFAGELNPVGAWLEGRIQIEGDVLLGARMIELFGGVMPLEDLVETSANAEAVAS